MEISQEISLHPVKYYACIEACFESANASWICADACLNEKEYAELRNCVDLCLTSAEACALTARLLARGEEFPYETTIKQLKNCILASERTLIECSRYADKHEHCFICAQCAEACLRACLNCVEQMELN